MCASPGLFTQFFTIARTRETLWHPFRDIVHEIQLSVQTLWKRKWPRAKHFGTFFVHVRLTVLKLASLEKKEEEDEERKWIFSKFVFLASIKLS